MLLGDAGTSTTDELEDPFQNDDTEDTNGDTDANDGERLPSSSGSYSSFSLTNFGASQARVLARHLTRMHLPGLSNLDQMYLLALADTVANTKVDFNEHHVPSDTHKAGLRMPVGLYRRRCCLQCDMQ